MDDGANGDLEMPTLSAGEEDDDRRYHGRGPAARMTTGAYGPHRHLGDSPPKPSGTSVSPRMSIGLNLEMRTGPRNQNRSKNKRSTRDYQSRREAKRSQAQHLRTHGSKTAQKRVQMAKVRAEISSMRASQGGDNDNTNENENDNDNEDEEKMNPLTKDMFFDANLANIGMGSVGVDGAALQSQARSRMLQIQQNFAQYEEGKFDTTSTT